MPGVTPSMWTWWFGWHGSDARRYKLWHLRAHVSAQWSDGGGDGSYVGRTSLVREYLGSAFARPAIQFVVPAKAGLDETRLTDAVAICARLGSSDVPVDVGWLVHHVRPTADGAEMRSRFWLGGRHIALRAGNRLANSVIRPVAACQLPDPRDLMVHRTQEMNRLAGFLPALYQRVGGSKRS
jgi:DAPG hydrolase PhiG domain